MPGLDPGPRHAIEVDSAEALLAAAPALSSSGEVELRINLDPDQPVEGSVPRSAAREDAWVEPAEETVEAVRAASTVVLLAGPGIVRHEAVAGLHDLAVSAGIGVLNTWGAKGVFDWRSRHHLATIGLQADDFVLSGLQEADLIIATGLDPHESPDARWRLAPALHGPSGGPGSARRTVWSQPAHVVGHAGAAVSLGGGDAAGVGCGGEPIATQPGHHALCRVCRYRCVGRR